MPPDTKALLSLYDAAYRRHRDGWPAPIEGGKDGKLAKDLLGRYTLDQLGALLDHYFVIEDAFIQQGGYTFGVFYKCLGKVITDMQRVHAKDAQARMTREYHAQRQAERERFQRKG